MDFAALIIFLVLYYLRPQEWFPDFNRLHPIQILSVLAIWALVQKRRVRFKTLVQTPLDWLVLSYFIWTLIAGFTPIRTFTIIQSLILLYYLGVCSLDSISHLKKFLAWWCACVFVISTLAVASQFGFDPFDSYYRTMGPMKGRLILNLSIFDNPNALAHSVIAALPLFYYLVFWRATLRKGVILLLAIPLYCIYLTQSKGAFLSGFATLLATLTFGRSRIAQVIIFLLMFGFGYSALHELPRMSELNSAQTDPAIQGRVAAFTFGLAQMRENFFGIGLYNFDPEFYKRGPTEKVRLVRMVHLNHLGDRRRFYYVQRHYAKATHSAYNQNGSELGYFGLFLFVGILYCCIRTLLLVKSEDDDEERIRRALFAVVVAYAVSSWMVDTCYRPVFFMMVASISAFHRYLLRKQAGANETVEEKPISPARLPWLRPLPPIQFPGIPFPGLSAPLSVAALAPEMAAPLITPSSVQPAFLTLRGGVRRTFPWQKLSSLEETIRKKFLWSRLGIPDFVIMSCLTYATILYWEHLIATM